VCAARVEGTGLTGKLTIDLRGARGGSGRNASAECFMNDVIGERQ